MAPMRALPTAPLLPEAPCGKDAGTAPECQKALARCWPASRPEKDDECGEFASSWPGKSQTLRRKARPNATLVPFFER